MRTETVPRTLRRHGSLKHLRNTVPRTSPLLETCEGKTVADLFL